MEYFPTERETLIRFYKVMTVPSLVSSNESRVLERNVETFIQGVGEKLLPYMESCNVIDRIRNENITREIKYILSA